MIWKGESSTGQSSECLWKDKNYPRKGIINQTSQLTIPLRGYFNLSESISSTESNLNLLLQHRLAGDADTKLLENLLIHITQHHGAMSLAATELWQLLQSFLAVIIIL